MEWIKCSDRMPEEEIEVLIFMDNKFIDVAFYTITKYDNGKIYRMFETGDIMGGYEAERITHWQPLPEPPIQD